ncbi:MAG: type II toxin-antitoxin system HicB family antitoxin [Tepidiformaceae bacterium]
MRQVTLTAAVWREEDLFVSLCPELGVASCGDDAQHAVTMLREAIELYIDNAVELGLLPELLPALDSTERFSVPILVAIP